MEEKKPREVRRSEDAVEVQGGDAWQVTQVAGKDKSWMITQLARHHLRL